jgi:hypothetical protein
MSQPPQGEPPYGPVGRPGSGDQPPQGGGWGRQPTQAGPPQQPGLPGPGGYGPPPGQEGWGQPPAPGHGGQPGQVGSGVPGQQPYPGGPGWGAPGAADVHGGSDRKRNLIVTAVAALVLIVVVAVVLVLTLHGRDDGGTTAGSVSPSPSGTAGLLAHLPADLTDCADAPLSGNGELAAASCGSATTQPGPTEAGFFGYPDLDTLNFVFQSDVAERGISEWSGDDDCATSVGYGEWVTGEVTGGQVACAITSDGFVVIAWTDEEYLAQGVVSAPGTTQSDVSSLYDWWTANSFFQD